MDIVKKNDSNYKSTHQLSPYVLDILKQELLCLF